MGFTRQVPGLESKGKRMMYRLAITLVSGFFLCGITVACEQANLPWHLLGTRLSEIDPRFVSITYDGDFLDEIDNAKIDERWLVIDKSRRYLTLQTSDRIVTSIFVSDELYVTDKGIRIGDTLSTIRGVYPDAFDQITEKKLFGGTYQTSVDIGKISFWFVAEEARKKLLNGETIDLDDESVNQSRLWVIHMTPK